mmetsp:Transcript_36250/g.67418  ORF Transcript_36250/g.67418 Transcript_36250/m.67418 type:complete len:326 (-) Transcript_36250:41-1018(-)
MAAPDSASAGRALVLTRQVLGAAGSRARGCRCSPTSATQAADDLLASVPIFPLQPVLPASEEVFHIFEPRYRLLLKDCLDKLGPAGHTGEFGMCWPVSSGGEAGTFSDTGTLLRVTSHVPHPDGRSDIRCVGVRRFRVLRRGTEQGMEITTNTLASYPTADIEWFEDDDEQPGSTGISRGEAGSINSAGSLECRELLVAFHDALLRAYPSPEAKVFLLRIHGPEVYQQLAASLDEGRSVQAVIDAPSDDTPFTWWVLNKVAVLPPDVKVVLILSQSPSRRLASAATLLDHMARFFAQNSPTEPEMGLVDGVGFKETATDPDATKS